MRHSVSVALNTLPATAFRLFRAGWNETSHGRFLFDQKAALSVMTAHAEHDVDVAEGDVAAKRRRLQNEVDAGRLYRVYAVSS